MTDEIKNEESKVETPVEPVAEATAAVGEATATLAQADTKHEHTVAEDLKQTAHDVKEAVKEKAEEVAADLKKVEHKVEEKLEESGLKYKLLAALSYFGVLAIIPYLVAKDNAFVKFHLKQGLVLIVGWVAVWAVMKSGLPFGFLLVIVEFLIAVLAILGIINSLTGKRKKLPYVGQYGDNFNGLFD